MGAHDRQGQSVHRFASDKGRDRFRIGLSIDPRTEGSRGPLAAS
jgi:hypothetical protein